MAEIKPEKLTKLLAIREQLLDVYIEEADPEQWVNEAKAQEQAEEMKALGADGKEVTKILFGWKGERYWEKKNANQTMAMLLSLERLLETKEPGSAKPTADDEDQDKDIRKFEREAKKRLARSRPALRSVPGGKG